MTFAKLMEINFLISLDEYIYFHIHLMYKLAQMLDVNVHFIRKGVWNCGTDADKFKLPHHSHFETNLT